MKVKSEKYQGFNGIQTQQIDLTPNVWLHSSVGRASQRYRGGHRLESRWSPDIFQASSFQLLKLENLLQWSLFTFTCTFFECNIVVWENRNMYRKICHFAIIYCANWAFFIHWTRDTVFTRVWVDLLWPKNQPKKPYTRVMHEDLTKQSEKLA